MPIISIFAEGAGNLASVATQVFTIAGEALTMVTSNDILLTFFGAGIVGIAIGAISHLKHA